MKRGSRIVGLALFAIALGACELIVGGSYPTGTGGADGSGGTIVSTTGSSPSDAGTDQAAPAICYTSCTAAGGVCHNGTCIITDNQGGIDQGTRTMLEGGGSADPSFKFLYPYDQTVFPGGILPPTMQFGDAGVDGAYVHISFPGFDYKGFFGASAPPRIVLSAMAWTAITLSTTGKPDVKVEVTKIAGGKVAGPVTETWTIAKGSVRGTIYYQTYGSPILGGGLSGGLLKIQPGAPMPTILKSGCGNFCHTASADGSTLVAATFLGSGASYDLRNNTATIHAEPSNHFTYGALVPDGSVLVSATTYRYNSPDSSRMYDTHTGAVIPAPGWDGVINTPGTPAFSPDGKKIGFNALDTDPGGHTLAVMDFDLATKTFSNMVPIATDLSMILAWPAFLPDTSGVVYHAGTNAQFETDQGATGDIFWTDVATHTVRRLDALDGYKNGGLTYLPANDPALNFEPTVFPEAIGGYFWVLFTSHRSYGNTRPSQDNGDQNGKLWLAAFNIGAQAGTDPSHPAFYLDGQEAAADNLHGCWVPDPCKVDGSDCAYSAECCEKSCQLVDGGASKCAPSGGDKDAMP